MQLLFSLLFVVIYFALMCKLFNYLQNIEADSKHKYAIINGSLSLYMMMSIAVMVIINNQF